MTKPSRALTPEEKARLEQQYSGIKKTLTPDTGPTSLTMGQSTPMNGQSPLQNNPRIQPTNRPAQSTPQNRPINAMSSEAQRRIAQNTANLQSRLGDRYSSFEEERKRIVQGRRGIRDKNANNALRELRKKYGLVGQGQTNNPTQNNFNQLRDTLNPQQPQQNAQQPQGALSQLAAQQPAGQQSNIIRQPQTSAQPQQPNPEQPQQAAQPPAQQAGQPEQTAPNQQAAPAQDNSSIDQQIAALQQQIAQLQAQKK